MQKITIVDGIIIENNQLLLLKKITKPYYELPGGKVKINEDMEDALKRELKEELGISILTYQKIAKLNLTFENKEIEDHIFLIEKYEGNIKNNEKEVFEKIHWQNKNELLILSLAPNIKEIVKKRLIYPI